MRVEFSDISELTFHGYCLVSTKRVLGDLPSGLLVDPSYNWGVHVPTRCVLMGASPGGPLGSLVGKEIIVRYLSLWTAMGLGTKSERMGYERLVRIKGEDYYLIPVDSVYGVIDNGVLYPVGSLLFFTYPDTDTGSNRLLYREGEYDKCTGTVTNCTSDSGYSEGDTIFFHNGNPVALEHKLYNGRDTKPLYRIEYSEILGKLE